MRKLLLFLLVGVSAAAQQKLEEKIEVSVVNVDVFVTDKKGNRVTGLTAKDFEIRENGKVQPVTNFSEFVPTASTQSVSIESSDARPAQNVAPRARRTIIVFIEPMVVPNFRARELYDSIRALLQRAVGPGDQVAVMTWDRMLEVRQELTRDVSAVLRILDTLERATIGEGGKKADAGDGHRPMTEAAERQYERILSSPAVESYKRLDSMTGAVAAATRQFVEIKQKSAILESLLNSISAVDGKKLLIMATRRFGYYAGAEFFGGSVPLAFQPIFETSAYRKSLVRTANAHGITLYPIYADGLPSGMGGNVVLMNEMRALQQIADETGGLTAFGSTDIAALLPRVGDDLDAYYSLGYRARASGRDAARSIVVTTKNPDHVIRSRRQIVEKSDDTRMSDRVTAHLFQPMEGSTVDFDVSMGKLEKLGKNRWSMPLEIRIPIRDLTVLPRGKEKSGEFSVFVATGGAIGVMSDVEHKTQPFSFPSSKLEQAKSSHFTFTMTLTVDAGADRVTVGVLDEVGKEYGLKKYDIPARGLE